MPTVLRTEDLRREFGELVAVNDVSVEISSDQITSLIGPNGAGKTTFYNLLTGVLEPTGGQIQLNTADGFTTISGREPNEISQLGLSRSYQVTNIFEGLTVLDNIRVARISKHNRSMEPLTRMRGDDELYEQAWEMVELVELEDVAEEVCENLSHGDRRKVEIAVALATDPQIALFDEPTAGMNPQGTDYLVDLLSGLNENTETTFMITEHDMDVVFALSDRVIVLDQGAVIADGPPQKVREDDRVTRAYLGE
jgi:branched-chain amino acid transport system ATP-binding protein